MNNAHMKESRDKTSIFLSTISTLIMTFFGIAYSLTWGILFIYYIEKKTYPIECNKLIGWGSVLYWLLLLQSSLHFISSIIKLLSTYLNYDSEIPNYIMMLKSCLGCITSIIILIGITITYFKFTHHNECNPLSKLIMAYIISEYSIIGLFALCVYTVCLSSYFCKRNYKYDNDDDLSDEEIEI